MTTKSPFNGESEWVPWSSSTPVSSQDDFCIEYFEVRKGQITDVRITCGVAQYGRVQRFRNWLYRRAPWLPSWVTGWIMAVVYRRPEKPFPDA